MAIRIALRNSYALLCAAFSRIGDDNGHVELRCNKLRRASNMTLSHACRTSDDFLPIEGTSLKF